MSFRQIPSTAPLPLTEGVARRRACAIGCFDGVHRGHRALLGLLGDLARRRGLSSMVLTFNPYPGEFFGAPPARLMDEGCKREVLSARVDEVMEMEFDAELAALSAEDFMRLRLRPLGVELLLMGYDHSFGRRKGGEVPDFALIGHRYGVEVVRGEPLMEGGKPVSSTRVRRLLQEGRVDEAGLLLGGLYAVRGEVVEGERRGRRLGYPTLNVEPLDSRVLLPYEGVYAVEVVLKGEIYGGMADVGVRPTFHGGGARRIEVNLFNFGATVYGERVEVRFVERLRGERAFPSEALLRDQLPGDRRAAEAAIEKYKAKKR